MTAPVVLAAVGEGSQGVADDAAGPLDLGVGVLVVSRADDEARPCRRAAAPLGINQTITLMCIRSGCAKRTAMSESSETTRNG